MRRSLKQSIRKRIEERDGNCCVKCRTTRGLEIHHIKLVGLGGDDSDENLITLCGACHHYAPNDIESFNEYIKVHLPLPFVIARDFIKLFITMNPKVTEMMATDTTVDKFVEDTWDSIKQVQEFEKFLKQSNNLTERRNKTMSKTKKSKAAEAKGYTRIEAFTEAIKAKKSGKIDALITLANQKYVAKGGKSNEKEATTVVNFSLKTLVAMKLATIDGDSYKLL